MKKILIGLLLFFVLTFPISAQIEGAVGEHIKSFASEIYVNQDGTIDIKEIINYDFDSLQKHGIYRDINFIKTNQDGKKYKLEFSSFSVVDEKGNGYQFSTSNINEKNIRLKIGDADKLITGIHNYIISYKVAGALTYFSDHDELYWNVTGNEWKVPIASTTSQVVWPQEIKKEDVKTTCYTGVSGSKTSDCSYLDTFKSNRVLLAEE